MFFVFGHKATFCKSLIKMLRKAYCHRYYNTKDCFHTAEDVSF